MEKRNVPKLRFKGFEDEWKECKLRYLSDLITKGTTPKKFSNEGIKFVKIESLSNNRIEKLKCLFIDADTHNGELKRSILEENDILFAIAGATIGKAAIVSKNILPANTNQALSIIRLKKGINSKFILDILTSRIMKNYIELNISVGAQPNLNLEQIGNFKFKIPSLEEQEKIANFLSNVDKIIEEQEGKVKDLELYKKGMMQKIFKQEIRFKDDNGQDYPKWEEKKLGYCLQLSERIKVDKIDRNKLLSVKLHLQGVKVNTNTETLSIGSTIYYKRFKNQFIYGKQNFFNGSFGIIPNELDGYLSSGDIPALDFIDKNIVPKFLIYYLGRKSFYKRTENLALGTGSKRIHESILLDIKIQLPCLEEQIKIANFLSNIDILVEEENEKLEDLRQWKKGLLQQMFV